MHDIALAFFWHQHQPYYPDDVGNENPMPWVRLHGVKDYWGMAAILDEFPEMRCTINLVPSLLKQIRAYTEEGRRDRHFEVSAKPADGLTQEDVVYLLDNFFMAHVDRMIRPFPRYFELYTKRGFGIDTAEQAAKRFTRRDLLDLQCWANLSWIHPVAFERDPELAEFRDKGRGWSEDEKAWLLDRQLALLAEVIPLHKKLAERGQIEITTTPFYHPILPLLWDKRLARQAMPDVPLPQHLDGYPEDVAAHLNSAVAYHTEVFGTPPRGMWPSEGSVCQAIIKSIAETGIQWIATDEEILTASTDGWVSRNESGYLRNPEMLYRPWRVAEDGRELQIVFRDHALSDQIGFHYQRFDPLHATADLIGRLEDIGRATTSQSRQRPTLVNITLDGENCWEYYANGGVDFLRELYRRVLAHPQISPVRIGDYLDNFPATDRIRNLFAGSWIQHNFAIWIGHPECNRAWDLVHQTRSDLVRLVKEKPVDPKLVKQAWEELYIAEGSDWYWWFGDSHVTAQKDLFDRLFRKHLQNVYLLLGEEPPAELAKPVSLGLAHRVHTQPTGLLRVKVDGKHSYFEWINAGRYESRGARGTMTMTQRSRISDLYFGFDAENFFLRLDPSTDRAIDALREVEAVRVHFYQPEDYQVMIYPPWKGECPTEIVRKGKPRKRAKIAAAADRILELAVRLSDLNLNADDPLQFCVELLHDGQAIERLPHEGAIETTVPSPDYEMIMWQA